MHFKPFSVQKKTIFQIFTDFFSDFAAFSDFFTDFFDDLLNTRLAPPPENPRFPTGPPLSFSIKNKEKSDADPQKQISDS